MGVRIDADPSFGCDYPWGGGCGAPWVGKVLVHGEFKGHGSDGTCIWTFTDQSQGICGSIMCLTPELDGVICWSTPVTLLLVL